MHSGSCAAICYHLVQGCPCILLPCVRYAYNPSMVGMREFVEAELVQETLNYSLEGRVWEGIPWNIPPLGCKSAEHKVDHS